MNVKFEKACLLENIMLKDTSLTIEVCEGHRKIVEVLYESMAGSVISPLTQKLREIIKLPNYLGVSSIISKSMRSFIRK